MSTNYAWATDVHLNFMTDQGVVLFAEAIKRVNCTGVMLTGDISHAPQLVYHLSIIDKILQRPIYFILGNHDFYNGNIEQTRKTMKEISNISPYLKYLGCTSYLPLSTATAIVGHDGWYDGLFGDWKRSTFVLNDWSRIQEYVEAGASGGRDLSKVIEVSRKLAHEAVMHIHDGIKAAVRYHNNIVVLTHVPPFQEVHYHDGQPGDANAMPWFTSKMMGDMLLNASKSFPTVSFTVLCGHTHARAQVKPAKNLTVYVGAAEYNKPTMEQLIALP